MMTTMWTVTHFPAVMRSLSPSTRAKAIEIANRLLEEGVMDRQRAVAISVEEARRWSRCNQPESDLVARNLRPYAC